MAGKWKVNLKQHLNNKGHFKNKSSFPKSIVEQKSLFTTPSPSTNFQHITTQLSISKM